MLMNSREICKSLQCAPQFARVSQPHMPLRSGLPPAVRGASAVRSGLPSGVCGTPGVGYSSHCADAATGRAAITKAARDVRRTLTGMAGSSWRRMLSQEPAHRRPIPCTKIDRLMTRLASVVAASLIVTTAPDPATDIVATRLFVTTTAVSVEIRVENATIANAIYTQWSGPPSLRPSTVGNTLQIRGNEAGVTASVQVDAVLTGVHAHSDVVWAVALTPPGSAQIDVTNQNHGAATAVDRFDASGSSAQFSTSADLLR